MSTDVPVGVAAEDLEGWLDQLPRGERVRLVRADGTPVALVVALAPRRQKAASFEEWEKGWNAVVEEVTRAWKGDKSGLEELAEMRR